jgi:hypothetical protein
MKRARLARRVQLVLGLAALAGITWRFWSMYGR